MLVVPDTIAKVSLLRFEKVPARAADLAALVSWQVRKSAPFPADQAQLSYVPGAEVDGAREFVVTMARRDIVTEYEAVCQDAGVHTGVVDLATFNLVNAVLAAGGPSAGRCAAGEPGARLPDRRDPARRPVDVLPAPRVGW